MPRGMFKNLAAGEQFSGDDDGDTPPGAVAPRRLGAPAAWRRVLPLGRWSP
jgi:hypothetical protein